MSARSSVESDRKNALRAYRDTQGKGDPERTVYWLEKLARNEFRGRGDTFGAAVIRVAKHSGAPISKTKRLWERWQTMKSVAGDVMIPLMLAYEEWCERIEAKADEFERQRLQLQEKTDADDTSLVADAAGVVGARLRETAE